MKLPEYCVEQTGPMKEFADNPYDYHEALRIMKENNPGLVIGMNSLVERLYEKKGQAFENSHVKIFGRSSLTRRRVEAWWRPEIGEDYLCINALSDIGRTIGSISMTMHLYTSGSYLCQQIEAEPGTVCAEIEVGDSCDHIAYRRTLVDLAKEMGAKYELILNENS